MSNDGKRNKPTHRFLYQLIGHPLSLRQRSSEFILNRCRSDAVSRWRKAPLTNNQGDDRLPSSGCQAQRTLHHGFSSHIATTCEYVTKLDHFLMLVADTTCAGLDIEDSVVYAPHVCNQRAIRGRICNGY